MSVKISDLEFPSEGYNLKGRIYKPDARGRHPAVVICHGFPGDTNNMDLAEELAFNGYVALIFYYQGAWGSSGSYSLLKLEAGTRDAANHLSGLNYVDRRRIGLIGHSMGSVPLTKLMSVDDAIRAGVLIAPAVDYAMMASKEEIEGMARRLTEMTKGKLTGVTAEGMIADLREVAKSSNPIDLVQKIKAPLIVIVGSEDKVTPPDQCRRLYEKSNEPKEWLLIEGADHIFSEHRRPLIKAILAYLKKTL